GVTMGDISITKRNADGTIKDPASKYADFGVFGLGYRPGRASVVSGFRLGGAGGAVRVDRLVKVAVHEVGHNLGLGHCPEPFCVMRDATERVRTMDQVGRVPCVRCRARS